MPQHKSCEKRMRTSARERARNRAVKTLVRHTVRDYIAATTEEKQGLLRQTFSVIDNAARKGVIKDATANRRKSRLAKLLNREQAATA